MSSEPLSIFDPRRNMHVQGFSGCAATTTFHDASTTGVSISGIFQAAEDFAVLCLYNAYDYFSHLRLKHLPKTDLSGLKLEFDIEYDQTLDGAIRFDAAKYPSVSWDAITFVCGAGDIYEVRLLDHATVVAGGETPASCRLDANGTWPTDGLDWLHLYFRDTRYTVASDQVEGTAYDVMVRFAEIINTSNEEVEGRYGPDQSGVISAAVSHTGPDGAPAGGLTLTFASAPLPSARYGKLGNLDHILLTSGHQGVGPQAVDWTGSRKLSIIRRFYEAARNAGLRPDNPAAGVKSPRVRQATEDFNYLCDEELAKLFAAIPNPEQARGPEKVRRLRNLLMVSMMALQALRTVEVHRANLEDLLEKGEHLTLLVRGKTRDRIIYLRPDTAARMKEYVALHVDVSRDKDGTPLFTTVGYHGGDARLSRRSIRVQTDKHLRRVGLKRPGLSNHALRHTARTLGYLHTGDLRAVQDFLGHADPRMTAKYAHVVDMAKKNPALFIPVKLG